MKNDFLTLIRTSAEHPRLQNRMPCPQTCFARVLEAGTYAPSAMGERSATIVAVETKAYRDRLTKLNVAGNAPAGFRRFRPVRFYIFRVAAPSRCGRTLPAPAERQPSSVSFPRRPQIISGRESIHVDIRITGNVRQIDIRIDWLAGCTKQADILQRLRRELLAINIKVLRTPGLIYLCPQK